MIADVERGSIKSPVRPSMRTSLHPEIFDAIDGKFIAPASINDNPKPSLYDGNTNKSEIDKKDAILLCGPVAMIFLLLSIIYFVLSDTGLPLFSKAPINNNLMSLYFDKRYSNASTSSLMPLSLTIRPTKVSTKSSSLIPYFSLNSCLSVILSGLNFAVSMP